MSQKSSLHYYEDGDVILIVQDTAFCLHQNYLSMASKVFRDMFSCATSYMADELHELPRINITDTSSLAFENFLSFIYPQKFVSITWDNIEEFCRIGDKYEFSSVLEAAEKFLESHFHENPLLSLILSDRYYFNIVYKESSKLVLNELQKYRQNSQFLLLSYKTKSAIFERYLDFTISITTIRSLKQRKNFKHHSLCSLTKHDQEINKWYETFFEKYEIDYINGTWSECDYRFFNDYLAEQFVSHFGNFEPLKYEKSKKDAEHYIKYIRINWENVASFLEIGDKYEIVVVIGASEEFLQCHYMENPLIAFALADQYDFKFVYKESSKLVLNNLPRFKTSPDFHKLSYRASSSLLSKHLDYILAIGNLSELNIQEYRHNCSYSVTHGEYIQRIFAERIKSVQGFPVVSPTNLYEIFFKFEEDDDRFDNCQKRFLKTYLPGIFSSHFGNFEPLNNDKNKHDVEHYPYLESAN
ncbi:6270_t:CDS:2 [Rhizophagus irregularis]|nr:6270_t:CDS:2 [Rhizophagus irregularis]